MSAAIELREASKRYGDWGRFAVEALSFAVETGTVLGLVGPNGAGKTTTIFMLAGLLEPSAGTLRVLGREVRPGLGDPRVGLVSGSLEEFDYLTGTESVILVGRLLGLPGREAARRAEALLKLFDLGGAENGLLPTYSSGMKQKIRVACALVGTPEVLLLDEPFEALDITASAILAEIIRRFAAGGGTVLLASHDLRLVERVATHYAILKAGRLVETGSLSALASGTADGGGGHPALEQRFWELTGPPAVPELDWLRQGSEGSACAGEPAGS